MYPDADTFTAPTIPGIDPEMLSKCDELYAQMMAMDSNIGPDPKPPTNSSNSTGTLSAGSLSTGSLSAGSLSTGSPSAGSLSTGSPSAGSPERATACPVCQEDSLRIDGSTMICSSCGVEVEDFISDRAEWNNYSDSGTGTSSAERCTQFKNSLYFEGSLSTGISAPGYGSSRGRKLLSKLQSWQMMPAHERTLKDDCDLISYICSDRLPPVVTHAAQSLFKMVEEERRSQNEGHRGDIRTGLIASVILNASKINKYHVSHKELATWFGIDETYVTQGNKIFFRLMCHKIQLLETRTTHADHINKFCTNLGLSQEVRKMAHEITDKVVKLGVLRDNAPGSVAAACIFFVISIYALNISRKLVSKQCAISEATISKAYNKLNNHLEHLL